ncbi:MFS transporter [Mesorhizobium xinjiangense]|uniref:MFS transporter n=1 Tax=Mesorhizobium xinjiangense TaxID=2678685 RepID=UPI0012EDB1F6|nr:MFS transporter [Mesorhizobium xinjiangense]
MLPTFAPFENRNFRYLWGATLVSNLGGLIQAVAAGWVMTTITDSPGMVALVQGATTFPIMLFSLASGALADNFDRRGVMLAAQITMMVTSAALALTVYIGSITPWLLLAFTFLIGCGTALHNPSWQASMGDIVKRDDIPAAVILNSMGFNLMRSIGPAIGGLIVAVAGAAIAFAINAFSYLPLIYFLGRWRPNYPARNLPRENFLSAISVGLRYVSMSPNLLIVLFRAFLFGLSAVAVLALLPIVASDILAAGALTYGGLLGAFGAGAIIGAFANAQIRARLGNETIVRIACLVFALSIGALGVSRNVVLSHLLLLPAGACWVLSLSLFNVTVQLSTPRWVAGRALSIYQTATFGGMAIGSWLWGAVADGQGPSVALIGAAAGLMLCSAVGLLFAVPAFSSLDLDPLNKFKEPALKLDLKARSGPIMVMVDYVVDQDDVPDFLAAMARRRRIRIRDGARQWALLRDLEHPEQWTESYHVPTWVEYVRHNQRRTRADAEVTEILRKLHKGPESPRVHRMIERQTVSPRDDDIPLKHYPEIH